VEPPLARQHFSSFVAWLPWVLLDAQTIGKLFFHFFEPRITSIARIPKTRSRDLSIPAALESYRLSANVTAEAPVWDAAAVKE